MKSRKAFTLIELLVVIAIIAILAAILFPVFGKSAQKGKETQSMNNLKQWASALNSELADNDNRMPFDGDENGKAAMDDNESWFNMLPPYFHDKALNFTDYVNKPPRPGDKSVWINPAVPKTPYNTLIQPPEKYLFCYGMNSYLSSLESDGNGKAAASSPNKRMKMNVVENLAATVFMAEKADNKPNFDPSQAGEILAFFGEGDATTDPNNQSHFLFCDGHVELIAFNRLFANQPEARRIWNYDHETHSTMYGE